MAKFIVDANLPYHFSLWKQDSFIHVFDLDETMTDNEILEYATQNNLTIVTKVLISLVKYYLEKIQKSFI